MRRTIRMLSRMLLAVGLFAAGLGASGATARPVRRTAVVSGYVQLCGGPSPGRCWKGKIGFCEAPRGCVTSHRVAAIDVSGRRVATERLRHGRFKLRLIPGRYTIELLGNGRRVRGQVMQQKRVWARAHRTTRVRFLFSVP